VGGKLLYSEAEPATDPLVTVTDKEGRWVLACRRVILPRGVQLDTGVGGWLSSILALFIRSRVKPVVCPVLVDIGDNSARDILDLECDFLALKVGKFPCRVLTLDPEPEPEPEPEADPEAEETGESSLSLSLSLSLFVMSCHSL
jgi:hypothetical protein